MDYESITVGAAAVGLTAAKFRPEAGPAKGAMLTLETAEIRFRMDGADPSASEGHLMSVADKGLLIGTAQMERFKAIRTGGTSGTLKVTYFF
jgi:hypothetical protein